MTRTEREYRLRALHEAAHAVAAEANGVRVDCVQIFTELDVNERQIIKISGAGGLTSFKAESVDRYHEPGVDSAPLLITAIASRLAEEMADFTDKTLIDRHVVGDMMVIQDIIDSNPPDLNLVRREITSTGILIDKIAAKNLVMLFVKDVETEQVIRAMCGPGSLTIPDAAYNFEREAFDLLCRPSITQAVREVAASLVERRRVPGADVRAILSECLDKFADADEELGYTPCKFDEAVGMAATERGQKSCDEFQQMYLAGGGRASGHSGGSRS